MTRTALPFAAPDVSALARFLGRAIAEHHAARGRLPGHVEMMNLLARSVGQRNLQAWRAAQAAAPAPAPAPTPARAPEPPPPKGREPAAAPALSEHARRALGQFDPAGRLVRWPVRRSVQKLAMWALWSRFESRRTYTEAEVNRVLRAWHLFGDHATLRRELINDGLMTRTPDCRAYRKAPVRPDAEAQSLLQALRRG